MRRQDFFSYLSIYLSLTTPKLKRKYGSGGEGGGRGDRDGEHM